MDCSITTLTSPLLDERLVAEGANGPTDLDLDGDAILLDKGVDLLPDILCNIGRS